MSLSEVYLALAHEIAVSEKIYTRESVLAAIAAGYEYYRPGGADGDGDEQEAPVPERNQ